MNFKNLLIAALLLILLIDMHELAAQENTYGFNLEVFDAKLDSIVFQSRVLMDEVKNMIADTIIVKDKNGKPVYWIGVPLLSVIEKKTGINFDQISKLITTAPDGYNSVISNELLPEIKAAYLVYDLADENKWLKKYGQFRLIFKNVREMYFVSNPEKIIVYKRPEQQTSGNMRFYFLGRGDLSGFKSVEDSSKAGIKIDDILLKINLSGSNFTLLTADSLQREYFYNDITQKMELKIENEGAWKITGKKVPVGLRTRRIFYLQSDNIGVFLKSLSDEEIILWENYLHDQLPKISDFKIEIVSPGDKKIPFLHAGGTGIYKSMITIFDQNPEANYVELISNH
ncbi:MAG: hypothetical protein CO127_01155 [Ignavibacteria bacterium CG_4_9_14_3_um_filter_36_18]|nr:hypothetical protein [Ignavibacteria bacterium]PJB01960.1 MAG: hypothetical protein CO127_01155 [Ignavibacteria bacterium CG_4_9_14_3_um_filter_36_18]